MRLRQPHLLAAADLTPEEIRFIFSAAKSFALSVRENRTVPLLEGKTIAHLFYENSTRTRMSFENATRRLGGASMGFALASSSVSKGETLIDTAMNLEAMKPHCLVVRHASAGSSFILSKKVKTPIVNAGDGFHEHPTQALLDVFTIEERLGSVAGKRVVILGDIAHSRVARSNIQVLRKLGASVAVCGPPTLLPPEPGVLGVDYTYRPEEILRGADVVMCLRVQLERQNRMQIPSLNEYSRFWGLNKERAALLKSGAIILHPGPVNRGVELDPELADGPNSVILDQVFNGVLIRMAVLSAVCNSNGLEEWMKKGGHRV